MNVLLKQVFDALELQQVAYCILRDGHTLESLELSNAEVDLLVYEAHFHRFDRLMRELGFRPFARLGSSPHTHYVKQLDGATKFEFDVVTRIAFGAPVRNLETSLAWNCIHNRRLLGGVYLPSAEDELFVVLLHCLLDKNRIAPYRAERIQALREQLKDKDYLTMLCAQYWSDTTTWYEIEALIAAGRWSDLLAQRKSVAAFIRKQDVVGTWTRAIGKRALRKLDRVTRITRPSRLS
jgi:hypothetical protein